ncbi:YqcC family protein [Salinicola avicenniae]|uniref:YqcC family protein n=1 Tax=Salinicola avicenniae TaxID=2916836 RepID=UPI00207315A9|nr:MULTISPECIES: YqcC family protein [unclassified Salinicola]
MTAHDELAVALRQLEETLAAAELWEVSYPDAEAFESQQPFCVDSMSLPQWLRYVFMARLQALVDARAALPANCAVAPAMEVWLQQNAGGRHQAVVRQLTEVDRLVTEG